VKDGRVDTLELTEECSAGEPTAFADDAAGSDFTGGRRGPAGEPGPMGSTGTPGATGAQGPTGDTGANGTSIQGQQGQQGQTGPDGASGPGGANGADGSTGSTGAAGSTGSQGVPDPIKVGGGNTGLSCQFGTGAAPHGMRTRVFNSTGTSLTLTGAVTSTSAGGSEVIRVFCEGLRANSRYNWSTLVVATAVSSASGPVYTG
jgi:collagen type I/II/III/V/XI/XXIV/XXVII alpha